MYTKGPVGRALGHHSPWSLVETVLDRLRELKCAKHGISQQRGGQGYCGGHRGRTAHPIPGDRQALAKVLKLCNFARGLCCLREVSLQHSSFRTGPRSQARPEGGCLTTQTIVPLGDNH